MSASYWNSSQRQNWLFTKDELAAMRQRLDEGENAELVRLFPLPEPRHLAIYFNQQLLRLAKRLAVRQQPLATAQIYLKRFYLVTQIRNTNPYLLVATSLYLACKVEESPQHIRLLVTEARALWQDAGVLDVARVGECEFWLISEMRSELIVHHPYRALQSFREQGGFFGGLGEEDWGMARGVVNDAFMSDLVLVHAPHVVALVGVLLALVLRAGPGSQQGGSQQGQGQGGQLSTSAAAGLAAAQAAMQAAQASEGGDGGGGGADASGNGNGGGSGSGGGQQTRKQPSEQAHRVMTRVQHFVAWLAESEVDVAAMVDVTQEVISYYACFEAEYNEKLTREQVNRFVKARGLDK